MDKNELVSRLTRLHVHPKFYSLDGKQTDNSYVVEKSLEGSFAVYFLERGEKIDLKNFGTEEEALVDLLIRIERQIRQGLDLSK